MGSLVYLFNVSLDGFIETPSHSLDWGDVDDELHAWFNERAREHDAVLYGRRLYETMAAHWPYAEEDPASSPVMRDFARIWTAKPKFVFSHSLAEVGWNGRLVRGDVAEELAAIRREFGGTLEVGGAALAASFIERGLVDRFELVVHPVVLGAGTRFFPPVADWIRLRETETRRFGNGARLLSYEVVRDGR
jgi:dihydrofolate reductase